MRVLLACDWFLKYAVPQAIGLHEAGASVGLVCRTHALEFGGSREERRALLGTASGAGVEIFELPGRVSSLRSTSSLPRLARDLRRWKPDLVHAHDNHDPRLYALACTYPAVLTIHDPTPHPGARRLGVKREAIRAGWMRRAARLVVHGDELGGQLKVRDSRVAVIPHGTTPEPAPHPCPADPSILFFGRLEPYKGLQFLLDAMQLVWARRPDVKLRVLGKGPESALVPADPRIELSAGYLPERELDSAFRDASLVVLPYVQASQSGVGLLALARGVPALVTDVGSLPELALDSSFVVPPRDHRSLAAAIVRHVEHGSELRARVLDRARTTFAWDVVARRSLELYREVLDGSSEA